MKTTILHHQSLLDLAIQHTGSVENAFTIAVANGLSLTDDLEAGSGLILPPAPSEGWGAGNDILKYYQSKNIQPATAITAAVDQPEGISYWAIGINFIVQ